MTKLSTYMNSPTAFKGHIVDLVTRRIFGGEITIRDGKIDNIIECEVDDSTPYFLPGFIDSHVHIESSMMTPDQFAHNALQHGSVGAVCDPHEIANVLGSDGITLMLDIAKQTNFHFAFGMPSCVPSCSTDIETSGFILDSKVVAEFLKRDDIYFLAEMMNFPGVLYDDPEVMAKIAAAKAVSKPIDGHAPGLVGDGRAKYAAAGISTDHECNSLEVGKAAIANGMFVQIRQGSAAKDYAALAPLIAEMPNQIMFCTDDCHPNNFINGHIDSIVKRAFADGYNVIDVLTAACLTPVKHYGIPSGLLQKGDPADFIAISDLTPNFHILHTFIAGEDMLNAKPTHHQPVHYKINNFNAKPISITDIAKAPRNDENIIVAFDGSLFTEQEIGSTDASTNKLVVLNRYCADATPQVSFIKGFNIAKGAMAQTIAHDCHNIVAVGATDEEIVRVVNRVIEMHGGIAVSDGNVIESLPLPIGGIMSNLSCKELVARCDKLNEVISRAGCKFSSPFITLAFMCLPVIPKLKLTDKGLFDGSQFKFIEN